MSKPTYTNPQLAAGWAHYASIHAAAPFMNDTAADITGLPDRTITISNPNSQIIWETGTYGRGLKKTGSTAGNTIEYLNLVPDATTGTLILIYEAQGNPSTGAYLVAASNFTLTRFSSNTLVRNNLRNQTANGQSPSGNYMGTTGGPYKVAILTWNPTRRAFYQSHDGALTDGEGNPVDAYTTDQPPGAVSISSLVKLLSATNGETAATNHIMLGCVSLTTDITQAQAKAIIASPWAWVEEGSPPANNPPVFDGPAISNLSGTESSAITPVDVSAKFSDADVGDTLTFSQQGTWPARDGGGNWVSGAGVISGTPAAASAGSYTGLTVRASDGTDTVDSNTFTFTVNAAASTAPVIASVSANAVHGQPLTILGSNFTGATVTISYSSVSVNQSVSVISANQINIASVDTTGLPYKNLTITVTVAGEGSDTTTVPHDPVAGTAYVNAALPYAATSDSIFEGPPDTAIAAGDQVKYPVLTDRGKAFLLRPDGTLRVADDVQRHTVSLSIWDESGLDWGTPTNVVITPSPYAGSTPTWTGPNIPDQNITVGDALSLDGARFTDIDDDITSYALVGSWPFWASINPSTGLVTGTAVLGTWSGLSISATDSEAATGVSNQFSITVVGPPQGPIWSGPPYSLLSFTEGDAVSINMGQFSDADSSIASYSVSGTLPPWAMFDTATGVISGTAEAGVWAGITVTATDTTDLTGTSPEITIAVSEYVEPVDPGPVVSTGRGKTLLSIVNSVLRRLREDTVTSLNDAYPCLIAEFVSDTHKEVVEACDWTSMDHDVVVLVKAGRSDYTLYEGSEDISAGSIPPNSRSIVRYNNDAPVAFLYATQDDLTNGNPLHRMDEANEQVARVDLWGRNSVVARPDMFSVFTDRIEDGVVLKLNTIPDTDYFLHIRWHTPENEISCDDDPERMVYAPSKPLILGAVFLALNERGEELGEPGGLAERRYRSALASEIETDKMRQIKTNIFEMYRD